MAGRPSAARRGSDLKVVGIPREMKPAAAVLFGGTTALDYLRDKAKLAPGATAQQGKPGYSMRLDPGVQTVATRLKEITVDPKTVTLKKPVDTAAVAAPSPRTTSAERNRERVKL